LQFYFYLMLPQLFHLSSNAKWGLFRPLQANQVAIFAYYIYAYVKAL
jgi:hypothetical protein